MEGAELVHHRLNDELEFFAEHAPLVIKDDQGHLVKFKFNIAQRYAHSMLEAQRQRTGGWVRACVLKGRQQGMSTYINARFFHRMMRSRGLTSFILSHEGKTTNKLFDMVHRFYENMDAALRPSLGKDNPREMTFPGLTADYSAGTAGNEDVGRGGTAQLFHGSEAAYWANAYAIQDGALESIRLAAGTEIILESTANGPVGLFYEKCQAALAGLGDYVLVFCAWFWEDDYEREDDGSALTAEEQAFIERYFTKPFPFQRTTISLAKARRKLMWRRGKVFDFSPLNPAVGKARFRSVYPSNPIEAFLATAVGEIRADAIDAARAADGTLEMDPIMPRIAGLDPASEKKKADRTVLAIRQGRVFEKAYRLNGLNSMEQVGRIIKIMEGERIDKLFVDNGYGKQMVDRFHELGYKHKVMGVWFNESADEPSLYANKRSEMMISAAEWVNGGGVSMPNDEKALEIDPRVSLCSGDEIHADFAALPMHRSSSVNVKSILPKEEMIKVLGRSPDILDAFGLTFAYPVKLDAVEGNRWRRADNGATISSQNGRKGGGPLRSLTRKREMR